MDHDGGLSSSCQNVQARTEKTLHCQRNEGRAIPANQVRSSFEGREDGNYYQEDPNCPYAEEQHTNLGNKISVHKTMCG